MTLRPSALRAVSQSVLLYWDVFAHGAYGYNAPIGCGRVVVADIFISYASQDREFAEKLADRLRGHIPNPDKPGFDRQGKNSTCPAHRPQCSAPRAGDQAQVTGQRIVRREASDDEWR